MGDNGGGMFAKRGVRTGDSSGAGGSAGTVGIGGALRWSEAVCVDGVCFRLFVVGGVCDPLPAKVYLVIGGS